MLLMNQTKLNPCSSPGIRFNVTNEVITNVFAKERCLSRIVAKKSQQAKTYHNIMSDCGLLIKVDHITVHKYRGEQSQHGGVDSEELMVCDLSLVSFRSFREMIKRGAYADKTYDRRVGWNNVIWPLILELDRPYFTLDEYRMKRTSIQY